MKHYKINNDTNVYFSTCTIVQWQCIFKENKYFRIIVDCLNYCIDNKGLSLIGYVIMLNHLHLITLNSQQPPSQPSCGTCLIRQYSQALAIGLVNFMTHK